MERSWRAGLGGNHHNNIISHLRIQIFSLKAVHQQGFPHHTMVKTRSKSANEGAASNPPADVPFGSMPHPSDKKKPATKKKATSPPTAHRKHVSTKHFLSASNVTTFASLAPNQGVTASDNDVLCGRGTNPRLSPGTCKYLKMVSDKAQELFASSGSSQSSRDKTSDAAIGIVQTIRASNARFLLRAHGQFYDMGESLVVTV